jgi:hypothetical protein
MVITWTLTKDVSDAIDHVTHVRISAESVQNVLTDFSQIKTVVALDAQKTVIIVMKKGA